MNFSASIQPDQVRKFDQPVRLPQQYQLWDRIWSAPNNRVLFKPLAKRSGCLQGQPEYQKARLTWPVTDRMLALPRYETQAPETELVCQLVLQLGVFRFAQQLTQWIARRDKGASVAAVGFE